MSEHYDQREAFYDAKQNMTSDRKNITQPADWWAAFEAAAEAECVSLAEWLGACGIANLPKDVAAKLSERGTRGRPPSEKPNT